VPSENLEKPENPEISSCDRGLQWSAKDAPGPRRDLGPPAGRGRSPGWLKILDFFDFLDCFDFFEFFEFLDLLDLFRFTNIGYDFLIISMNF